MKILSAIALCFALISPLQAGVGVDKEGIQQLSAVRELYAEVEAMELAIAETELKWEDEPLSGLLKLSKAGAGEVRRAYLGWGAEHGGWMVEAVFDETGAPRFVILEKNSWKFAGAEGQTEDRATQTRFYFSPKRERVTVLRKAFVSTSGDEGLQAAADKATNQVFNTPEHNGIELQNLAAQLKSASAEQAKALAKKFAEVLARLDQPAPSPEPVHWRKVEIPAALTIPNEENADLKVLSYLMQHGLVSEAEANQEGNYEVTGFVLTGDPGHRESPVLQTVTTASGLMDDAVMAQRFLATFELTPEGEYELKKIGLQQKGWPDRGPQGWR